MAENVTNKPNDNEKRDIESDKVIILPEKEKSDDPALKKLKQKLEQESREKYGIPKSSKPVAHGLLLR